MAYPRIGKVASVVGMKKSRFTDKQMPTVVRQMEAGAKMLDLVRRMV